MKCILNLLYIIVSLLYSPVIIYRAIKHKRYREGWGQRFGKVTRENPEKKCIWIHAVSVGEVNAAKTVVKELRNKFADIEILTELVPQTRTRLGDQTDSMLEILATLNMECLGLIRKIDQIHAEIDEEEEFNPEGGDE